MIIDATIAATRKIPLINGLRGIAILGVVLHHLYGEVIVQGDAIYWLGPIPVSPLTLITNSYQGVALFFMLSGFVLTLPYIQQRRTMLGAADIFTFFRRRALRLFPLYIVALIIGLTLIAPPANFSDLATQVPLYITGIFTFTERHFFPDANFVLWSLGLELLFSLLFPFILICMQKFGVWKMITGLCIVALIARIFGVFMIQEVGAAELFPGTTTPAFNHIFCRIDDFVLGMGLAVLYVRQPQLRALWFYILGFLSLLVGCTLRDLSVGVLPLAVQPFSNTFVNLGMFALITTMLLQPKRIWTLLLENRPLQLIGLMCYSIFVWHGVLIFPLQASTDLLHLALYTVVVCVVSFLSYRYIEFFSIAPLRNILPRRLLP